MNVDKLLNIYQTYSLEKISALSKKGLAMQYTQCEQLINLKKELASNTSAINSILRNQIKELERQEKNRYYKNLIFNTKQAVKKIENIQIVNLRIFLSSLYLFPAIAYINEAMQNLEEIADKEYAHKILERINNLKSLNALEETKYAGTCWSNYIEVKTLFDSKVQDKSIKRKENEIKTLKREENKNSKKQNSKRKIRNGCLGLSCLFSFYILGVLIYSFITNDPNKFGGIPVAIIAMIMTAFIYNWNKKIKDKNASINNNDIQSETAHKIAHLQKEIAVLVSQKEAIDKEYTDIVNSMNEECSNWKESMLEIMQLLPHDIDNDNKSAIQLDPLLQEAALCIVKTQSGSTSLIQRKFSLGYNRAGRIMDQLEELGIVGPDNGSHPREVLCDKLEEANKLLNGSI